MKEINSNDEERLMEIISGLKGLASLFKQQQRDPCYQGDDIYGIGVVLDSFQKSLYKILFKEE